MSKGRNGRPPQKDSERIISDQARELRRLRRDLERSERDRARLERNRARLEREQERLRRENDKLKEELEAARRAAKRQAAPFSRGDAKPHPRRPGRKAGKGYGRHGRRPIPSRVDETLDASLPKRCPGCGGSVRRTRIAMQYQEELPVVQPLVRAFRVHVGCCRACKRRVQGRHPLQTSDALGAASVHLGPQATALAAMLNKQFGMPFAKIAALFRQRFSLHVTAAGLVHALHRVAKRAEPSYQALCATVRGSPAVSPDETGWRVSALLVWLWAFVARDTTVYAILPGRGFEQAASILGKDFAGGLSRDGWAIYRQFVHAVHQTCLAHLLRRCRTLRQAHPHARLPMQVEALLKQGLRVRDRRDRGEISAHGAAVAGGRLSARLLEVLEGNSTIPDVERFANHLATEFVAVFNFLFDPALDATNWRAEQAIRPAVVTRKMCGGGNRTWKGAHTQQVLASVLRTAAQRNLDATDLFVKILRAPLPIVPHELRTPLQ